MPHAPHSRRLFIGGILTLAPLPALAQTPLGGAANDFLRGLTNGGATGGAGMGAGLSQTDIGLGLKDALKVATRKVVGQVGKADGYFGDPAIRIPLPASLDRFASPLRNFGGGALLDDLSLRMNRAAEQAAPKALNIFVDAVTGMSFEDARGILTGPQDSATQYFRRTTSAPLTTEFRPVVRSALDGAGAMRALQSVQGRIAQMPMVAQMLGSFDLVDFTVGKALDGLFHYVASEEKAIRTNPAARTTDLLRRVFR
jgi:hypothetical protein